jgi:hypothetical protein
MHGAYYATSYFFVFFENEAITHKLQPPPQNKLSPVQHFCQGLIFAGDFLQFVGPLNKYSQLFSHRGRISAHPENHQAHSSPKILVLFLVAHGH